MYQMESMEYVPALKVEAVNTVGAGDTFAGAMAAAYLDTQDLVKAVKYGNAAAGLKVSREGGQDAIPEWEELIQYR